MERKEDHYEVACACDATGLFNLPYIAMLESLGKFDERSNFVVLTLAVRSLLEAGDDDPGFEVNEASVSNILTMLMLAAMTHLEMTDVGICGQIRETVDLLRDVIPLTVDQIIEGKNA